MIVVTNVMLSTTEDKPEMLACFESIGSFGKLTFGFDQPEKNLWGGTKYPECTIWAGAFNHLDLDKMLSKLESIEWEEPEFVQVMIKEEEEETFKIYMFDKGKLVLVLPSRSYQ